MSAAKLQKNKMYPLQYTAKDGKIPAELLRFPSQSVQLINFVPVVMESLFQLSIADIPRSSLPD